MQGHSAEPTIEKAIPIKPIETNEKILLFVISMIMKAKDKPIEEKTTVIPLFPNLSIAIPKKINIFWIIWIKLFTNKKKYKMKKKKVKKIKL